MMRTTPSRRTILQCSHRTLTDGLTFIVCPFEPFHRSRSTQPSARALGVHLALPLARVPLALGRPSARTVSFEPVSDPAAGQVVRRQLDLDLVPGQDPDEVHAHLA